MSLHAITDTTGTASLADLRRSARAGDAEAAREAAKQFEALFVNMMIKQMRQAMPTSGGMFGGEGMKLYESMHDQQLSLAMSQRGGIGLAASIERQLLPAGPPPGDAPRELHFPTHRLPARVEPLVRLQTQARAESMAQPAAAAVSPASVPAATPAQAAAQSSPQAPPSPEAFVKRLLPHARRAAKMLGVAPEVLIAQSALETGWGRYMMRDAGGQPSNNLFGIKATGGWSGDKVRVSTLEYRDGVARRETAAFRGYSDEAASFADYVRLIGDNPRYRQAVANADSPEGYLRGLQKAGYATDPEYADKILSILQRGLPGLPGSSDGRADAAGLNISSARPTTTQTGGSGVARLQSHPAAKETT
jgi:flagellar protein FlgJ